MNLYPLDAAGAGILFMGAGLLVFVFFLWAIVEGLVIFLFKINRFWRSVGHATIVKVASLIAGFGVFALLKQSQWVDKAELTSSPESYTLWAGLFLLTVIIEGLLLKALNRSRPMGRVFLASIVMNLITYIIIFALVAVENR